MSTATTPSLADREAELKTRAAKLSEEIQSFVDRIDAGETLTPEQSERFERQTAAVNRLQGQIEEVHDLRLDEIRHFASIPSHVQSGDGARVVEVPGSKKSWHTTFRGSDPWEHVDVRSQTPTQLRDRAMYALEASDAITDDMAHVGDMLVNDETDTLNVGSRWTVAASNPAYRSAFDKYLRYGGEKIAVVLSDEERAAVGRVEELRTYWNEGTGNQGAFAVPIDYDLSISRSSIRVRRIRCVRLPTSARPSARRSTDLGLWHHGVVGDRVRRSWGQHADVCSTDLDRDTRLSVGCLVLRVRARQRCGGDRRPHPIAARREEQLGSRRVLYGRGADSRTAAVRCGDAVRVTRLPRLR